MLVKIKQILFAAAFFLLPMCSSFAQTTTWAEGYTQSNHCFGGHLCDPESGLIYMRGRYYDPSIGRFISADPVEGLVNKPITWNPYVYGNANPLYYIDPDGRIAIPVFIGVVALTDYLLSDKREQAQAQIQPESYAGFVGTEAYAFSQAMANTLSLGYYDSVKAKGATGYVDHTKDIIGVTSFEAANREIWDEDGDAIFAALHAMQGSSQAILTMGNVGIARGYRPPEPPMAHSPQSPSPTRPQADVHIIGEGSGLGTTLRPLTPNRPISPEINTQPRHIEPPPVRPNVPGRVESRINVSNEGMAHVVKRHFSPSTNASQFTISESELRSLLQSRSTASTPVSRIVQSRSGDVYVREVNVNYTVGLDKFSGNLPTSTLTIVTDKHGNLITSFPGKL
jgi:RHS repeat-associated protein